MFTTLLLLSFQIAPPGQQPPAPNPADLCTIQGVVEAAGTGEPLHKASVDAFPVANRRSNNQPQGGGAITDASGRFEIKDLAPGNYHLSIQRNGYVSQEYGQHNPGSGGTLLTLSPGQKVSNITVQLIPAAVISGHVLDEDGEPVVYAQVTALHFAYQNGQRQLMGSMNSQTNDLGEFRLFGLTPGQYFVRASVRSNRIDIARTREGYVPIYYPGVPDAARAAPVTVKGGDEFSGVDISLQPVRTLAVKGVIVGCPSTSAAPQGGSVFLVDPATGNSVALNSPVRDLNGQKTFEFPGVPPGSYVLSAMVMREGKQCAGHQSLEVTDADVEGVTLNVSEGLDLHGQVRLEGQMGASGGSYAINLRPRTTTNGMFYYGANGGTNPDGTFTLKNIHDGDYELSVGGLANNYYLKSARLDGIDALTTGITIDSKQTPQMLDILISPNGASVNGVVLKDQDAYEGATVTLVPNPPYRGQRRLYSTATSDQNGHFLFQGLAPGDYKVFAWEKIEPGAYTSTEFLQPYEDLGGAVHVAEGSQNSVQINLIPAKDASQ
jgi:hypothetical protein